MRGEWEGNVGVDLSYHNKEDETAETGDLKRPAFRLIPIVENGDQSMYGLNYSMTAWRHGEESMDPFHHEVGYLLWEAETGQVMRCFAVPRGIAILAGGDAAPATGRSPSRPIRHPPRTGWCRTSTSTERLTCPAFESTFALNDDGSVSYTSDLG